MSKNVIQERDDKIEMKGIVDEALPSAWFRITVEGGNKILATLSGKMRQNHIYVLPGDTVLVEVSPYDLSHGRVSRRL